MEKKYTFANFKIMLFYAEVFVDGCSWFYMPSFVHKELIYGKIIIESASLPIGWMSEEAQKA